jgi:hypothetical protein
MLGLRVKCATQTTPKRIIYFTGHPEINDTAGDNKMITRVYGDCGTVSGLLHDSTYGWLPLECASQTLSNLYNLHACRGCIISNSAGTHKIPSEMVLDLSASMSGPHHYLGHIDPRDYITIHIPQSNISDNPRKYGLPIYTSYTTSNDSNTNQNGISTGNNNLAQQLYPLVQKLKTKIPDDMIYTLSAENWKWISGKDITSRIRKRYNLSPTGNTNKQYINTATGGLASDSLFPSPGILELGVSEIRLPIINPDPETNNGLEYDFTCFGVQFCRNSQPWQFRQSGIHAYKHAQHKLRLITYYYGDRYVDDYLMKPRYAAADKSDRPGGSGLFIERHEFIQAITPINSDCGGFVILGRELKTWTGRLVGLELIGVRVPFGFTLLVEPWAIHGDSNLVGLYSMAMTGNHEAMSTADTVFLKNHNNGANVKVIAKDKNDIYSKNNVDNANNIKDNPLLKFPDGEQKLLIISNHLSPKELLVEDINLKEQIRAGCSWWESWYYNPVIWAPQLGKKILGSLASVQNVLPIQTYLGSNKSY